MQNNESRLKEISDFIKSAKDKVLTEINKRNSKNIFEIIFRGLGKAANLEKSQSLLDKALNEVTRLSDEERKSIAKLQSTLNEKNEEITKLQKEIDEYNNKLEDLEAKILKSNTEDNSKESNQSNETSPIETNEDSAKLMSEAKAKEEELTNQVEKQESQISQLEKDLSFFKEKAKNLEEVLNTTSELAYEFSERVKRLKTEITAS
ncbi:MAG: hypothetical protein MK033_01565 [Candidatus Caenarcaniphilales bacterium]|nr:hypothetical protein [Candidatus Caenarcaniphilales bacterium]